MGILRQLVVRDHVSSLLLLGEVIEYNHGHLRQAQIERSQERPVTDQDGALLVHQNRPGKPELPNAGYQLRDLLLGVNT